MALEKSEVIDAVGLERATDIVVLTLVDAWDWEVEKAHLVALQLKLNAYFDFIEGGRLLRAVPYAEGNEVRIDVHLSGPYPASAAKVFELARRIAAPLGVTLETKIFDPLRDIQRQEPLIPKLPSRGSSTVDPNSPSCRSHRNRKCHFRSVLNRVARFQWWARRDLNPEPTVYETAALTD